MPGLPDTDPSHTRSPRKSELIDIDRPPADPPRCPVLTGHAPNKPVRLLRRGTVVAFLFVLRSVGGAAGTLFGGWFGDYMHARYPDHGRVFVAQMTVFLGIPAMVTVLHAIPQDASSFWLYAVALFAFGFVAVWTPPATNRPILCESCAPELRASILGTWVGKAP